MNNVALSCSAISSSQIIMPGTNTGGQLQVSGACSTATRWFVRLVGERGCGCGWRHNNGWVFAFRIDDFKSKTFLNITVVLLWHKYYLLLLCSFFFINKLWCFSKSAYQLLKKEPNFFYAHHCQWGEGSMKRYSKNLIYIFWRKAPRG